MSTLAFRRTRRPIGGSDGSLELDAWWRAGYMNVLRVRCTVKRSAWSIRPVEASPSQRASPGRIGRPAASAEVHVAGRRAFERRFQIAPEPAAQVLSLRCRA